jgi:hypothetical protein
MSHAFISALQSNAQQSYVELLNSIRDILEKGYSQLPQLSSSHPIGKISPASSIIVVSLTLRRYRTALRHVDGRYLRLRGDQQEQLQEGVWMAMLKSTRYRTMEEKKLELERDPRSQSQLSKLGSSLCETAPIACRPAYLIVCEMPRYLSPSGSQRCTPAQQYIVACLTPFVRPDVPMRYFIHPRKNTFDTRHPDSTHSAGIHAPLSTQ